MKVIEIESVKGTVIFFLFWFLFWGVFIALSNPDITTSFSVRKDIRNMVNIQDPQQFMKSVSNGESCYGAFTIRTNLPANNKTYGVPNSLYYSVTRRESSGHGKHKSTNYVKIDEDICGNMLFNDISVDQQSIINKLYWSNAYVRVTGSKSDIRISYIPTNFTGMVAYSAKEDCFILTNNTTTPLYKQYTYMGDLPIVCILLVFMFLPIIVACIKRIKRLFE